MDWTIVVTAELAAPRPFLEWVDGLCEALDAVEAQAAVVSSNDTTVSIAVCVSGSSPRVALAHGERNVIRPALEKAGIDIGCYLSGEAVLDTELERRLAEPNLPELVGVSEIGEMLGVTRQRAWELSRQRNFPAPIMQLAAGPIWVATAIQHFADNWERKPGRPRSSAGHKST
jgi:hypothetical protein